MQSRPGCAGQPAHRFEGLFQELGHSQSYAVCRLKWKGLSRQPCNFLNPFNPILPDGQITHFLSSPLCKNILLPALPKSLLYPPPSRPMKGRIAIVTDAGRDAVDAAASGDVRGWQGGSTRPVS